MNKNLTDAQLAEAGVGVMHHFGGKAYVKETFIPAGASLTQHAHDFDHLAYLVSGQVMIDVGGNVRSAVGPHGFKIPKGITHGVTALSPVVWLCIWGTDCTDAAKVDAAVERGQ